MITRFGPGAGTGIALDNELVMDKCAQIVEAVEICPNLRTDALADRTIVLLEHGPPGRSSDRIDNLQAKTTRRKAPELAMRLTASSHRDCTSDSRTPGTSAGNYVEPRTNEPLGILFSNIDRGNQLVLQSQPLLIKVLPGAVGTIQLAEQSGNRTTDRT